jgi:drug/metabolite transporter (DMT)-like permease
MSLEAVFGVFFAWLILGEILSLRMAFGALLVFVAILLSQKKSLPKT